MNIKRVKINLRIALHAVKRAAVAVFELPSATWTADGGDRFVTHGAVCSHPSLLCECPGGADLDPMDHLPNCKWVTLMCKECQGWGYCTRCAGDGCEPIGECHTPVGQP